MEEKDNESSLGVTSEITPEGDAVASPSLKPWNGASSGHASRPDFDPNDGNHNGSNGAELQVSDEPSCRRPEPLALPEPIAGPSMVERQETISNLRDKLSLIDASEDEDPQPARRFSSTESTTNQDVKQSTRGLVIRDDSLRRSPALEEKEEHASGFKDKIFASIAAPTNYMSRAENGEELEPEVVHPSKAIADLCARSMHAAARYGDTPNIRKLTGNLAPDIKVGRCQNLSRASSKPAMISS
jgi:hypothetical protein